MVMSPATSQKQQGRHATPHQRAVLAGKVAELDLLHVCRVADGEHIVAARHLQLVRHLRVRKIVLNQPTPHALARSGGGPQKGVAAQAAQCPAAEIASMTAAAQPLQWQHMAAGS